MIKPLHRSFPIVAAALGRSLGVRVEVHGNVARTNGTYIQIPSLRDDTPETRDVAWGFLAHEAAHLRWTDFEVFRDSASCPLRQSLLNVIEDIRIERLMVTAYPGTQRTLQQTVQRVLEEGGFALPGPHAAPAAWLQAYCLLNLRAEVLGQTVLSDHARIAGDQIVNARGLDYRNRVEVILQAITGLETTAEALDLVDRLLALAVDAVQDDPAIESPTVQLEDAKHPDPEAASAPTPEGKSLAFDPRDLMPDPFAQAAQMLEAGAQGNSGWTLPIAEEPPLGGTATADLWERSRAASTGLRASLEGFVQSSVVRFDRTTSQGHRLDPQKLHRLYTQDIRIFRGRTARKRPDTAIHLLVDRSPSMSAWATSQRGATFRRIDLAWEATLALVMALEAIPGVNPAITAFPGRDGESTRVYRMLPHGRRLQSVKDRIGTDLDGSTPLAEALHYGAFAVLGTPEKRKILLVLTDGIPDDLDAAQAVLKAIREAGIEVHGIGLDIDVRPVFGEALWIQDVSDLSRQIFRLCRTILSNPH